MSAFGRNILQLFVLIATTFSSQTVYCFSRVGHESIAELAYASPALLPSAKAAIDRILATQNPNDPGIKGSITDAAEWPDEIKAPYGAYCKNAYAKAWIKAHPNHHVWHYVDFPVGTKHYVDPSKHTVDPRFATENDIVHAVRGCIAILEGTGTYEGLSQLDALRYLLHLVGDAHQPFHTASGYYDVTDKNSPERLSAGATIPADAWTDTGGNNLYYNKTSELHAAWDANIVNAIAGGDTAKLVKKLSPVDATKYATGEDETDYHDWILLWVEDSMKVAKKAYAPVALKSYDGKNRMDITLPATYVKDESTVAKVQVTKGAARLTRLLNAIKWKVE